MKRSEFLLLAAPLLGRAERTKISVDVAVYGGSPAGLAAARAAVRGGATVAVVDRQLKSAGWLPAASLVRTPEHRSS